MGIAKWRLLNSTSVPDEAEVIKISPKIVDPKDDMEMAYVHVRYQKLFDQKESEFRQQQFGQMKETRQQLLKPIKSMGIKKFSKQYDNIRKSMFDQIHQERLQLENKEKYVPPSLSRFGVECFDEEAKHKEFEDAKRSERMNSNKKRDKYWIFIRDLYAPKVSDTKRTEMQQLIERINNNRLWKKQNDLSGDQMQNSKININKYHNGYLSQDFKKKNLKESSESKTQEKINKGSRKKLDPYIDQTIQKHTKAKSESFDYLKYMRSIREQEGVQIQSKAGKLINNISKLNDKNSIVLVNMARICEKEAKRKEQLCEMNGSLNSGNVKHINQMYMDSIKAKLKYLESLQSNDS